MSPIKRRTGRHFTDAARAAGVKKRREMALNLRDIMTPEVFVVRLDPSAAAFTWEIRRFGGLVVSRGEESFSSMTLARSIGVRTLAALVQS